MYARYELSQFDIERLFFYEDYFTVFPKAERTKEYVYKTAFMMLWSHGDRYAAAGRFLGADCAYTTALKYAQSDGDRYLILEKQKPIADRVSATKAELEEAQRKSARKDKKGRLKDGVTEITAIVLVIIERDPVFELFYRKQGRVFLKTVAGVGKFENSRNQTIIKTPHFRKLNFREKHGF